MLDHFQLGWTDADHEFQDKRLQQETQRLVAAARALMHSVGHKTWNIRDRIQTVKSSPKEPPTVWEARAALLEQEAAVVVAAHQSLVRLARRWEGRSGAGSLIVSGLLILVSSFPGCAFYRAKDREARMLGDSLALSRRSVDSLLAIVVAPPVAAVVPVSASGVDRRSPIRARLARFVSELDTLGQQRPNHESTWMAEEDAKAWKDRVLNYLLNSGLDHSYYYEFKSAASEDDERTFTGHWSVATQRRRVVLMKFIDILRTPLETPK